MTGVIDPNGVPTASFDYGVSKWLVTPETVGAKLSLGIAVPQPGKGHGRHNHPNSEEVLYVISGQGSQMIDDNEPFSIRAGDVIYVPAAVFHSTFSCSWEPLQLLAIHNPGGAEETLSGQPGFVTLAPGEFPQWSRIVK